MEEMLNSLNKTLEEKEFAVKVFETFVRKVDPKNFNTLLLISDKYLEIVLATLQETEVSTKINNYHVISSELQYVLKGIPRYQSLKEMKEIDLYPPMSVEKDVNTFMNIVYEAAKEKLIQFKEVYNQYSKDCDFLNRVYEMSEKGKFISTDYLERFKDLCKRYPKILLPELFWCFAKRNKDILEKQEEKQGPIYSEDELSSMKRQKYIDAYNLELSSDVALEEIEEVIKASSSISLTFLQNHSDVFKDKKEIYLENIKLLKEVIPDLRIVVERDPEAFLASNLKNNLELIKLYQIDLAELLYYRENALTDLSYFQTLDLMIENYGTIVLNKLLDRKNNDLRNKIVLRLLGLTSLDLKGVFPLTNSEIDTFLEQKSTVLKNGMNSFDECILDVYSNGGYFYNINGIIISRPKVLRNINGKDEISVEDVCCNSFFNKEEIETIRKAIDELKKDYQLKKQKI